MRRWLRGLLAACLVLLFSSTGSAVSFNPVPSFPVLPVSPIFELAPVLVAFDPTPARLTDVLYNQWDLNRDGKMDLAIETDIVYGMNDTTIQLLDPPVVSLDLVQKAPATGYMPSEATRLSRVYMAKLPGGDYAKFMLLQVSPKRTVWWSPGKVTNSELRADGAGGQAALTWDGLPDAALGYEIVRWEKTSSDTPRYTVLNDLPVEELSFVDNTAENDYYIYELYAIKENGMRGSRATVAGVRVLAVRHILRIPLSGAADLDGLPIAMEAPAEIRNGCVMAPASVLERAGVTVTYSGSTGALTLMRKSDYGTHTIGMTLAAREYSLNGASDKLDVPPYLRGSTVMVPLRVVAPALGLTLAFDKTERAAVIAWYE